MVLRVGYLSVVLMMLLGEVHATCSTSISVRVRYLTAIMIVGNTRV